MKKERNMKGVIFDMDGTMVDNMMVHHHIWQQVLRDLGLDWSIDKVKAEIHGVNTEILKRLFDDRFSEAERIKISNEKEAAYRTYFKSKLQLIEGLPDFLERLYQANIPMAIGTAAPKENADFVLDTLNIRHYFKGVFHAGSVQKGKPDPEIFIKAAASMDLSPTDCLVFEDSISGAATAKNAGSKAIIVTTTHQVEEFAHFDHIIQFVNDFTEVEIGY